MKDTIKQLGSRTMFVLLLICTLQGFGQQKTNNEFSFIFMTDIHIKHDLTILSAYRKAIAKANALNPDFVLSGGDQVFDVMRGDEKRADSLFMLFQRENKALKAPMYTTVGNHDLFGIYKESTTDSTHHYYKYGLYKKYFGETYYSFDHKGWHFVVLNDLDVKDQKYIGSIDDEQLRWLSEDLQKISKKTPVVIVLHIPLVTVQNQVQIAKESIGNGHPVANKMRLFDVLAPYNFKIALQGHLHFYEDIYVNHKTHFITGGAVAGRPSWRGTVNGPKGFLHFKIKDDSFTYDFVEYE